MREMARMSKSRKVLQRQKTLADKEGPPPGVEFGYEEDGWVIHSFRMSQVDFEDFGEPETITVTVEPGDRLND